MTSLRPQFFENKLQPVNINKEALLNALDELRAAVRVGVDLIKTENPPPDRTDQEGYGTLFEGNLGNLASCYLHFNQEALYLEAHQSAQVSHLCSYAWSIRHPTSQQATNRGPLNFEVLRTPESIPIC